MLRVLRPSGLAGPSAAHSAGQAPPPTHFLRRLRRPPSSPHAHSVALVRHIKKVWPSGRLIRLSTSSGGAGCSQSKNQFISNRFKLLLQQPSSPQLRLTVLTKRGPKKVHARPVTSAVQQSIPAADRCFVTWRAVHQTKRLEAGVSLGMLGANYQNRWRRNRIM
jgi:hypothetical protein